MHSSAGDVTAYLASLPPGRCRKAVSNFSPGNLAARRIYARWADFQDCGPYIPRMKPAGENDRPR